MTRERLDVMKGTLILLVLRSLEGGPRHGYEIMRWIRERADGAFQIEEGAIYPTLHRLRAKRLIRAEWGVSEGNRKAKFYELTAKGEKRLRAELTKWQLYVEAVANVIGAG
ncbi:MAG: PadR family transcriptional regulator [Gemmatimonadota bacterium]|nr:MAG: PadR family transcriptional regulator [Gemmatimonadota bacterium]